MRVIINTIISICFLLPHVVVVVKADCSGYTNIETGNTCSSSSCCLSECTTGCTTTSSDSSMPFCTSACSTTSSNTDMSACAEDCSTTSSSTNMSGCQKQCTTTSSDTDMSSCTSDCSTTSSNTDMSSCVSGCSTTSSGTKMGDCLENCSCASVTAGTCPQFPNCEGDSCCCSDGSGCGGNFPCCPGTEMFGCVNPSAPTTPTVTPPTAPSIPSGGDTSDDNGCCVWGSESSCRPDQCTPWNSCDQSKTACDECFGRWIAEETCTHSPSPTPPTPSGGGGGCCNWAGETTCRPDQCQPWSFCDQNEARCTGCAGKWTVQAGCGGSSANNKFLLQNAIAIMTMTISGFVATLLM